MLLDGYYIHYHYVRLSSAMLIKICSKNRAKLRICDILVGWFDFVKSIQKIIQRFYCILYLFDLRIMVFHLRLLLDIVMVPNVVELIHLYDLTVTIK